MSRSKETWWENVQFFQKKEFRCPCCGRCEMDEMFVYMLDHVRRLVGRPLQVTSGFRCKKHNQEVGGRVDSAHLKGLAADFYAPDGVLKWRIVWAAMRTGFVRVGIGRHFVHLDHDLTKPHPVMWTY